MSEIIKHKGKIIEINSDDIKVEIEANAACGSCSAKKICGMTESETKIITVKTNNGYEDYSDINPTELSLGQEVELGMTTTAGISAALLSYFYPVVVLIAVLILTIKLSGSDLLGVVISFAALALYYALLKKFGNNNKKIRFFILR
ncbi:SoxR reducing system RseC family protein [Bacteroidales bacterium OttesenSCG-928-K03]|nr:SoxR reducing system RseC family protein [Odoribacter sp. OttesenSCG-928-L07]MDL2242632.1 SoxR reducing system RseC family protein [Bacteroidales bacterium OttesenSCG-928-K03]